MNSLAHALARHAVPLAVTLATPRACRTPHTPPPSSTTRLFPRPPHQSTSAFLKSETGSGKTLAYILPIVQALQALPVRPRREDGTLALVLAPTRELCVQIMETAVKGESPPEFTI